MKKTIPLFLAITLAPAITFATIVVNDDFADGDRTKTGALDADWYYSTASSAIEVGSGFLGLVTGTSGRGIHGTFSPVSLNVGDTITATFTFTTPATVGASVGTGFRAGLFNEGPNGTLSQDISASSGSPSPFWQGVPGYMFDLDVQTALNNADISFRERQLQADANTGRLMATTSAFDSLGGGGDPYIFAPNTEYVGVYSITRTGADSVSLFSSLSQSATLLSSATSSDDSSTGVAGAPTTFEFRAVAFHVNSNTFGSSNTAPDNGIDFTNVMIEYTAIPEPSTSALLLGAFAAIGIWRRRK